MRSERSPEPISDLRADAVFCLLLARLLVLDARGEHRKRLLAVLVLRARVLAFDHDAGGQVRDADRGVGLVDVLAAGARGAEGVDAHLRRVEHHVVDRVRLGQHGNGAGRGVDAPLRLGLGHALHAVAARLEFEPRVGALAADARDHFLVAAQLRGALGHDLDLPAPALGIARVHAEQVAGEERRLVAAGAGAHLEEQVALVVRVLGQQLLLQLRLELLHRRARALQLLLGVALHRRVGRQVPGLLRVALRLAEALVQVDQAGQLGVLARQPPELVHVARRLLGGEQAIELFQPPDQAVELVAQLGLHEWNARFTWSGTGARAARPAPGAPRPRLRSAPASGRAAACW